MNIPKISEITLAKNATEREDVQRASLARLMPPGGPHWGYRILDRLIADVFGLGFPLTGVGPSTPVSVIERTIRQECRFEQQRTCLLEATRALHHFVAREGITGRHQPFGKMYMGRAAGHLVYWAPMVLNVEGRPTVIFVDPRRSGRLSESGIRFVLSMMNEHIRANDPDYAGVRLAVLQIDYANANSSRPFFNFDDGLSLFSLCELQSMIDRTYAIWNDLHRRQQSSGKSAAGS